MTATVRKLTAILAADVAGYSRLMGADEEGTLTRLKTHRRELIDPKISEHRGRIVKTTGDGMLVEFGSVVDAVKCAVEIQRTMRERETDLPADSLIQFRIGVNTGDVIIDGDDIHGDGVNVVARLEALAEPGTICMSAGAWDQVRGKIPISADDLGEKRLKNIERAVRVYRISVDLPSPARSGLALPDKPSIAVLPFQNMSGDSEQEYFSDGMAEEIITALSRFHSLFVIARNSSFTYKGKAVDVRQVARDLGVRYVLEGSVRKSGQMVRITGQLIDATTGKHLWADKFDGDLADVFELQDKVAVNVVTAIEPKIRVAEIERAKRKPAESLDAYDLYLRALSVHHGLSKDGLREAVGLLNRAINIHPQYAPAYGLASASLISLGAQGWSEDREGDRADAIRLARLAIASDRDDYEAMSWAAWSLAYHGVDVDQAINLLDRSLAQNPNYAPAWMYSGGARICIGDSDTAIAHLAQAQRLSPRDPNVFFLLGLAAFAHMYAGRLEDGVNYAKRSISERSHFTSSHRALAACYVLLGREDEAKEVAREIMRLDPSYSVGRSRRAPTGMGRHPRAAIYHDALLRSGLPE